MFKKVILLAVFLILFKVLNAQESKRIDKDGFYKELYSLELIANSKTEHLYGVFYDIYLNTRVGSDIHWLVACGLHIDLGHLIDIPKAHLKKYPCSLGYLEDARERWIANIKKQYAK
jgi:hypothetical protein